jgi:3'-phosphoadenosine 5'-phosphosulfate sulfotransferase (PAPS reductase)/FAD synthetase
MSESTRVIVTVSGGKASAWCAQWALKTYPKEDVLLYFNDTKWEHPDLYRFLDDLSEYLDHPITEDSDGRSPEDLFIAAKALANNLMPFCSRILKAERLQEFYRDGDILIFGIGPDETHRAERLVSRYQAFAAQNNKWPKLEFPLIKGGVTKGQVDQFFVDAKIKTPYLYEMGFKHNNCSGGCVRAGKLSWKRLLDKLPEVYAERERVEREARKRTGKDIHFLKDETLEEFRGRCHRGEVSGRYDDEQEVECMGICTTYNWKCGPEFSPSQDT